MTDVNRQWLLRARPEGWVEQTDFELAEAPVPKPADGQLLMKTLYLAFEGDRNYKGLPRRVR